MTDRTLISDLKDYIGKEVTIAGWVDTRRDHGKLIFIDLRDRSGKVQMVALPNHAEAHKIAGESRSEWVVEVKGKVNARPERMVNKDEANGTLEIEALEITTLAAAKELPFEQNAELNLDTYLDYLPLTLRRPKQQEIFKIQATVIAAFRAFLKSQQFVEFQAPALVGGDAEGGASAFKVDYYYNQKAFLATSPQLYKQIMAGVYERVFTTPKIFRGEKHATARHLSELTQMDFEMAFVKDHRDVMAMLEQTIRAMVGAVVEKHKASLAAWNVAEPLMPTKPFPILTLREAQEIISKETGVDCTTEPDLEPEHERQISQWAAREHGSDFVFITHYPTSKRPFYTIEDPADPTYTRSFDLLFRGLEINSGSQRVHDYDVLINRIKAKGLDPEKFSYYLQAFKYGMPPHGGCSTGLERFTMLLCGLSNTREAVLFPRDMNRIDKQLSQ